MKKPTKAQQIKIDNFNKKRSEAREKIKSKLAEYENQERDRQVILKHFAMVLEANGYEVTKKTKL